MTSRRFPHHDAVIALHGILTETCAKAKPNSDITKYPASSSEAFLDMARAVTEAGYLPRRSWASDAQPALRTTKSSSPRTSSTRSSRSCGTAPTTTRTSGR